jgi:hypothetical protein
MACFTADEAKRLIGIVNMGAAVANLANGLLVALLIRFAPGGSFAILPAQMVLLLLQLIPNAITRRWVPEDGAAPARPQPPPGKNGGAPEAHGGGDGWFRADAWYMHPLTQLIALWQFITVLLFSCIEFQYNSTLAEFLDADGIAQVTANLASVASLGQTIVNLFITPYLLQNFGLWLALLVTPAAYVGGEALIMSSQTVATVFACRSMDFIFRYTISDNTKQILYKAVPPHQLIDTRSFTDGTIKKLAPMVLGGVLIVVQALFGEDAFALVLPMAFGGLGGSLLLMPIVLKMAEMGDATPRFTVLM